MPFIQRILVQYVMSCRSQTFSVFRSSPCHKNSPKQCTQRWNEEQEKTEAALTGLTELDARTVARLETLGEGLKDRQHTVLAEMKQEREVGI